MEYHLRLAQISDIHLALPGAETSDNDVVLLQESGPLLAHTLAALAARADLDCVVVTGDVIDSGRPADLDDAIARLNALPLPWFAIPGNHDIAFPPGTGRLDRRGFYEHLAARTPHGSAYAGAPGRGSWTAVVKPGVRLIGLDSNVPGDWSGHVDTGQIAWLDATLAGSPEPLVVLLVHHPLHRVLLAPGAPTFVGQDWAKFTCDNGAAIETVLNRRPQVRLVLSGHDHINRVDPGPCRVHANSPALCTYPLVYRTVEITVDGAGWTAAWEMHDAADAATRARAAQQLRGSALARSYAPDDPARFLPIAAGRAADRQGHWAAPNLFGDHAG